MSHIRLLALLSFSLLPCFSQDLRSIVGEWQPLTVGDRWVYVREMRTGTPEQPRVEIRQQEVTNRAGGNANILVRDNCIFFPGWRYYDVSESQITADSLPDVCFPLRQGMTWGDPKKGRDLWTVAGLGKKHPDDPASVTPDSWRLEAHLASGDDNYVWFRKGVGVVAARTWHNGTYTDESVRLLRFEPGPRR